MTEIMVDNEGLISGSISEVTTDSKALIHILMRKVCSGFYAAGISWNGYSNGTVTVKGSHLYVPEPGNYESKLNSICMNHYFPGRNDLWLILYEGLMVFIQTDSKDQFVATQLAKDIIAKDMEENKIIMRDL